MAKRFRILGMFVAAYAFGTTCGILLEERVSVLAFEASPSMALRSAIAEVAPLRPPKPIRAYAEHERGVPATIEIVGDARFVKQVESALLLIADRDPDALRVIDRYIGRIRLAERSGIDVLAHPPTFELAPRTAYHSLTWCAGSIAHDAIHSKLYQDAGAPRGNALRGPRPWSGQQAELTCIAFQIGVMEKIRAPRWERMSLAQADGMHFDLDGDGVYTWNDYWLRDW